MDKFNEAVGSYANRLLPEVRRFQELRGSEAAEALPQVKMVDSQPRESQLPDPSDKPTSD